jgi:tetratricopeptide (TPR) repeat protein
LPPIQRLQSAIAYVRQIIPTETDIVWAFLPGNISDRDGYKELVSLLIPVDSFEDWLEGHRFFIRDEPLQPFLLPDLEKEKVQSVLVLDMDFSTAKVADSLVSTVNNNNVSTPERMSALLQLAAFDFAYQRFDEALEKYDLLHSYYVQEKDEVGQALALSGAGDVHMRAEDLELARVRYQQALVVAVSSANLPVIRNLLMNAGESCLGLQDFAEAEGYFDLASQAAGKLTDPFSKILAMEKRGIALVELGRREEAAEIWTKAKELGKQFNHDNGVSTILDRLVGIYRELGWDDQLRACEAERAAVSSPNG